MTLPPVRKRFVSGGQNDSRSSCLARRLTREPDTTKSMTSGAPLGGGALSGSTTAVALIGLFLSSRFGAVQVGSSLSRDFHSRFSARHKYAPTDPLWDAAWVLHQGRALLQSTSYLYALTVVGRSATCSASWGSVVMQCSPSPSPGETRSEE